MVMGMDMDMDTDRPRISTTSTAVPMNTETDMDMDMGIHMLTRKICGMERNTLLNLKRESVPLLREVVC